MSWAFDIPEELREADEPERVEPEPDADNQLLLVAAIRRENYVPRKGPGRAGVTRGGREGAA